MQKEKGGFFMLSKWSKERKRYMILGAVIIGVIIAGTCLCISLLKQRQETGAKDVMVKEETEKRNR